MLTSLLIKNYALIKHLEIQPEAGLNIITGETGAGKSIMLGAMGLLMGNRADTKALFDENEKCVVEGNFDISKLDLQAFFEDLELDYEPSCLIRREISPNGKSRAFVNDTPVTLDVLKTLGVYLMDIHSQHDTLLLNTNAYQLALVDAFAGNQALSEKYLVSYKAFKSAEKALAVLQSDADSLKKEFDYNKFLLDELIVAKLVGEEQAELEEELMILENAEEVKRKLGFAYEYLNNADLSVLGLLKDANVALGSISGISEKYAALKERINSSLIELQDISNEIESEDSKVETDDEKVVFLRDRLNAIFRLQQKHAVKSITELIEIREDLQQKVSKVVNLGEELEVLQKNKEKLFAETQKHATALSESRKKVIQPLVDKIQGLLAELGMPDARLLIGTKEKAFASDGIDDLIFEFSANKGSTPKPLKDVASGGEFSRVMLSLKYVLAEKKSLPTIIFDEIDTGISGEVAIKVGKMLTEMSSKLQVIAITHLHQIAGKGQTHFYVYKDNSDTKTVSLMRKLEADERIIEVAKMIGGQNPSESAIRSAIEMLENNN
ncbi:DNA repair protein RecN [Lacihabitans soyangensis]|uniref:DNA repair protein RecN n=1 Tax=Lacihabitans soyangensis TaxID=869394 RepID=A0AAE3H4Q1_9BACT|nr:DNA repair protein RecN [Lacihabitans soyangensis]MCP9764472.1 DNA repair protein RecN [Lacihabitans soyangensis]